MAVTTFDRTRTQREREVKNALAGVRMEALEPSEEAPGIGCKMSSSGLVAMTALILNYRGFASLDTRLSMMQGDMKGLNKAMTAPEIDVALLKDEGVNPERRAAGTPRRLILGPGPSSAGLRGNASCAAFPRRF